MSIQRATRALLVAGAALAALAASLPATAQGNTDVSLSLVQQTPWTTARHPMETFVLHAENDGTTSVSDLSVTVTIGDVLRSRTEYNSLLDNGLTTPPIFAVTFQQDGSLDPGQPRRFEVAVDLSTTQIQSKPGDDSAVFPAQIDLRTSNQTIASLAVPLIRVLQRPEAPLQIAWWIEVAAPPAIDPDGKLAAPGIEVAIAKRGWLRSEVEAVAGLREQKRAESINVVVEPALLNELLQMSHGYARADGSTVAAGTGSAADAAAVLEDLRQIAADPDVSLSALPYAAPEIPSLLEAGLAGDVEAQRTLGDERTEAILGVRPTHFIARPPAGALSDAAIDTLAGEGALTLLANTDTVARPEQENEFAPPPVASVTTDRGATVRLILPDPSVRAMFDRPELSNDPARLAQTVFGELALIWREQPVPGGGVVRGLTVQLPPGLPRSFWQALIPAIARAPFLRTVVAEDLPNLVGVPAETTTLAPAEARTFSAEYIARLKSQHRNAAALRSMLPAGNELPNRLDRFLLLAESGAYLDNEGAGSVWLDRVADVTGTLFSGVLPDTSRSYSFTSGTVSIPLQFGDPGPTPLTVVIQLRSNRFRFPDGDQRTVRLIRPGQIESFRVEALATDRSRIDVLVRAPANPDGHIGRVIDRQELVVRVTALNRIAVGVTLAAALVLVVMWSRRWWRRTTT